MAQGPAQSGAFRPVLAILVGIALTTLGGCTAVDDDRARLFNEDGVRLFSQGDFTSALDSFDCALTLKPQDATLLFNMGECYDRLGDVKNAQSYYGSCLMRAPNHADAQLALVALLYRIGEKPRADQLIDDWTRQNPKSADTYVLDAWRLRQARQYPEAEARLQQARDLEPHNRRVLAEYAQLCELMGMPQRAYVLYERILEREPWQSQIAQRREQLRIQGVSRPLPD